MYLSAQLSCYPLREDYKQPIHELISRLQKSGLEVYPNRMSTQIFGEYDEVMSVLADTMKWSFETYGKAAFTVNFLQGDRRPKA